MTKESGNAFQTYPIKLNEYLQTPKKQTTIKYMF